MFVVTGANDSYLVKEISTYLSVAPTYTGTYPYCRSPDRDVDNLIGNGGLSIGIDKA